MVRRIGLLAGVAVAVLAAPLAAQGRGAPGRMMAGPSLEELKTALALTETQVPKVDALIKKFEEDTKEPRATMSQNMQMVRDGSVTQDAVREANQAAMGKIREGREKLNEAIKAELDETQKTAFDKYLAAQAQRGPGRRPPPVR